jgi:hypothetical protein
MNQRFHSVYQISSQDLDLFNEMINAHRKPRLSIR